MLLYGMGDPVAAVAKLAPWIRHVHAKDATPSPQPGVAWGNEVPWGEGRVNAPAFLAALKKAGYAGAIANIALYAVYIAAFGAQKLGKAMGCFYAFFVDEAHAVAFSGQFADNGCADTTGATCYYVICHNALLIPW